MAQTVDWNGFIVTISRFCSSGHGGSSLRGAIQNAAASSICFKVSKSWTNENGTISTFFNNVIIV